MPISGQDLSSKAGATLQEQLADRIRQQISSGTLHPGDKLPSEHELCDLYGVSRITVRAALTALVREGLIVKRQGKGAFVREPQFQESVFSSGSFTDTCLRMGAKPSTHIESVRLREASDDLEAALLGNGVLVSSDQSAKVIEITRLREVDGTPCIVEVDVFPSTFDFLMHEDLADRSILGLIRERTGLSATGFEDRFRVSRATKRHAELLGCKFRAPLLDVEQVVSGAQGTIYVNHQFILTERYVYAVQSRK